MEDKNIKKHKFQTITNINNVVCWGWKSCGFWLEYKLWKYIPNMHNNVIKKATKQHGCEFSDNIHLFSPTIYYSLYYKKLLRRLQMLFYLQVLFILLPHHIYVSLGLNGMRHKSQNNVHFWLSDFWRVSLQANQICSSNDLWSCQVLLYREAPSVFFLDTY